MIYYPYLQSKKGKIAFGVFLFVLLYITRNTMTASAVLGIQKAQFLTLGLMAVLGIGFLVANRRDLRKILTDSRMAVLLGGSVILLFPMIAKSDWQMMYISVLLCMLYAVFFTYFISVRDLAKVYIWIMAGIGVYSILTAYILRILPDRGILNIPIIYNLRHIRFYFFGTYVPLNYVKVRNFGLFREPGVYQYYLTLALFLNNYIAQWKNPKIFWSMNIILAVTLLTTLATGGVAGLGLLVLVVFFERKLYRDKRIICLVIVLILLFSIALGIIIAQQGDLYWELYSMVIGKFVNDEEKSSSERIEAIVSDFEFFVENPMLGGGIVDVLHAVENNTTSTMLMLAIYGIFGGILHIVSWLSLVWGRDRKLIVNLCMVLIVFVSFNTQNLIADTFFWMFPMMALTEKIVPGFTKKEKT